MIINGSSTRSVLLLLLLHQLISAWQCEAPEDTHCPNPITSLFSLTTYCCTAELRGAGVECKAITSSGTGVAYLHQQQQVAPYRSLNSINANIEVFDDTRVNHCNNQGEVTVVF